MVSKQRTKPYPLWPFWIVWLVLIALSVNSPNPMFGSWITIGCIAGTMVVHSKNKKLFGKEYWKRTKEKVQNS